MPADYWGFIDPERQRIERALLSAQLARLQEQPMGAMDAGGGVGGGGGLATALEDDSLEWEQLALDREKLKEQTELLKAQQLLLERKMTLEEEEAQAPFEIGGSYITREGEPLYEPPMRAGLGETIMRPSGEVLKEPLIKVGTATVIDRFGNPIYSEPEVTVSGSEMIITNRATGDIINRIDISQIPRGFEPQMDAKGNVYVTSLDTGESELAFPSAYYEMEYELSKAEIEAGDRKLVSERYKAGYVPQTAEEALAYEDKKAQIEASYAPYTSPNDMNIEDAEAWLAYKAGIDIFIEKGKTNEKIRYENVKARAGRTPEDILKQRAISAMGIPEQATLGGELLGLPLEQLGVKREEVGLRGEELEFKREEAGFKREGEALGIAREDTEHLMAMMGRATTQIKATLGLYTDKDRLLAAGVLMTLIEGDMSISPETKARWLEIAPVLQGVTLAETLDKDIRPEYEWMRDLWRQALTEATGETTEIEREVDRFERAPATLPSKTHRGLSFAEIQKEVNRIYRETGSREDVTKYLKKYGMTIDDYGEELRSITPTE